MKKIVLMVAVVACVAFASQGVQASAVQVSVENVMQDDFVKIEVKELPQAVQDAIAKSYEGSTVKEAYVAGADGANAYSPVIPSRNPGINSLHKKNDASSPLDNP